MHAFLLKGKNPEDIAKEQDAKIIPFILQKVEDARELKKFIKFSFSEKTAILIENIDEVTSEAANAFLKNLEEPSRNIIYILTATNLDNVLPTIVSRCQVIIENNKTKIDTENNDLSDFFKKSVKEKIEFVGKIKERNEAINLVQNLIQFEYKLGIFDNQENYLNTLKNLKSNGNVSLQLTNFVVTMNR